MFSLLLRIVAFTAFVVFGIIWSSEQTATFAWLWGASFVVVAVLAVWADLEPRMRPTLSGIWASVPGPSTNPEDYR